MRIVLVGADSEENLGLGMVGAAAVTGLAHLDQQGVRVLGALPRTLPPLADLPWLADRPEAAAGLAAELVALFDEVRLARTIERGRRAEEILAIVWIYNQTGDEKLLELARKIEAQAYRWKEQFADFPDEWKVKHGKLTKEKREKYVPFNHHVIDRHSFPMGYFLKMQVVKRQDENLIPENVPAIGFTM